MPVEEVYGQLYGGEREPVGHEPGGCVGRSSAPCQSGDKLARRDPADATHEPSQATHLPTRAPMPSRLSNPVGAATVRFAARRTNGLGQRLVGPPLDGRGAASDVGATLVFTASPYLGPPSLSIRSARRAR